MDALDLFFKKYSYKFPKGYPDLNNKNDVMLLEKLLKRTVLFFLPFIFNFLTPSNKELSEFELSLIFLNIRNI